MGVKMMLECVKLLFSYTKYTNRMSKTLIFPLQKRSCNTRSIPLPA